MEDCCAVCAEPLEWVAYGACGHREVCSTCVARLRFVLLDRRCCICKVESSAVFVTKAMGDYTTVVKDFSVFPIEAKEGRVGRYWYHEDTESFFDDSDQYKMIKAMCKLSCNVCDKLVEDQGGDCLHRRPKFRNIGQLKGHLFHEHKLFMCSLCLEGRKAFVCEQKLYTRAQLSQHTRTGDSVVDGTESERGGFMGHPMCEFCRKPYYGDNELYTHMSREHDTCHICQRQHPGQHDYFRNYEDLEMHFRDKHFLCENEACIAKKFVVFVSETEMKRHYAKEHGENMSRSQRNAAFQIPTNFTYSRSSEQERVVGRGRGRGRGPDCSNSDSNMNMPAANSQRAYEFHNTDMPPLSSTAQPVASSSASLSSAQHNQSSTAPRIEENNVVEAASLSSAQHNQSSTAPTIEENNVVEAATKTINSLKTTGLVQPPKYLQAATPVTKNVRLEESSFPTLPGVLIENKQHSEQVLEAASRKNTLAARLQQSNRAAALRSSQPKPSLKQSAVVHFPALPSAANPNFLISKPNPAQNFYRAAVSTRAVCKIGVNQSKPAANHSMSPPQQAAESAWPSLPIKEVQSANKSLVEKIRSALGMDEEKFAAFKQISGDYRRGQIETWEYLSSVQQFQLLHLVPELASLCPEPDKQRELMDTYNANFLQENFVGNRGKQPKKTSKFLRTRLGGGSAAALFQL